MPPRFAAAVMDAQGKVLMECVLETKAATILEFIQGLRGTLAATFEEGILAAWLHDLLEPHVSRLVVCDPRKNALLRDGNQNDRAGRGWAIPCAAVVQAIMRHSHLDMTLYYSHSSKKQKRAVLDNYAQHLVTVAPEMVRVPERVQTTIQSEVDRVRNPGVIMSLLPS